MVIRKNSDALKPIKIEDTINYGDFAFSDSDGEDSAVDIEQEQKELQRIICPLLKQYTNRQKRCLTKSTYKNSYAAELGTDGVHINNQMGARKWKRVQNAQFFMSLTSPDDICYDLSDMVPTITTAFSQLFVDPKKMEQWNNFMAKDEVEQNKIIAKLRARKQNTGIPFGELEIGEDFVIYSNVEPTLDTSDLADVDPKLSNSFRNPAFKGSACFDRINGKLKKALSKSKIPIDFIDSTDNKIRHVFEDDKNAVWIENIQSSQYRLYVHAIAQYNSLQCNTIEENDNKLVEIRNTKPFYIPPYTTLGSFIINRNKRDVCQSRS
uniref:R3H-assoc domain-containing protein n=1 Tax=Rhabditophanes sp. KR3021 TaxID=114890 RepID=A0AC35U600_9BILA